MKKYTCLSIFILCFLTGCTSTMNKNTPKKADQELLSLFAIDNYNQNISYWINQNDPNYNTPLLTSDIQQKHFKLFYDYNYGDKSPWNKDYVNQILHKPSPKDITNIIQTTYLKFSNKDKAGNTIGYGANFHPYDEDWISDISYNINIPQFNNLNYHANNRAIAITNLHARDLPTNDVYFYSHKIAGEGYPFDNLQTSSIWAGTPLYVIGVTKDKSWSLVIAPDLIAWVESSGIAKTSAKFVSTWQKAARLQLAAITDTKTSIIDLKGQFLFSAYIGSVFPMVKSSSLNKKLIVPSTQNGYAVIKYSMVPAKNVEAMPLKATLRNISKILSGLIGRPYGWGNMYFYNDCAAELKSFFAPFGIWLPRQSCDQANVGKTIDMSTASPKERLSYLIQNGKPFFTTVCIGGHIFIYVGNYPNSYNNESSLMAMTYQNLWGLKPPSGNTRSVIGKAVFFPLLLEYPEATSLESLAAKKYFHISYLDQLPE